MISKFLHAVIRLHHLTRNTLVISLLRLRYGSNFNAPELSIAAGVRLAVTDGGKASFAENTSIDRNATVLVKHGTLAIGRNTFIGIGSVICARESITIGENALLGEYVTVRDQNHEFGAELITSNAGFNTAAINIGNNVWLGAKSTITAGVTIGDNSVIGANSVVTENIPAGVVAAGTPAKIIRDIQ